MRRVILLLFLILPFVGCATATYDLPEEWRPLEQIRERGAAVDALIDNDSTVTTIGKNVYVKDLEVFLERNTPASVRFRALMRHEQEHAIRQFDYGLWGWITRYTHDVEFMWQEEARGWYYELTLLQQAGRAINPDVVAASLSNYKNISGRMVSFDDAKTWVLDVLAGRWSPPQE